MQWRIFVILFFSVLVSVPLAAASRANRPNHFGLGLIVGEPTGISGKYVFTEQFALQGALGLSVIEKGFWLNSDFLLQFHNVFTRDGRWPLYLGGGLILQDRGNSGKNKNGGLSLGIRAVAGVEFLADDRVTIFGELSAQPFIIPSLDFGVGLALGIRYWF